MKILRHVLIIVFVLFTALTVLSYLQTQSFKKEPEGAVLHSPFDYLMAEAYEKADEFYRKHLLSEYQVYADQNPDYMGHLSFESGIISEAVMYSGNNDKYLRKDFYLKHDTQGTVFMDMDCTLDSRNITMYGHYVYYDEDAKFTPLHLLKEEENYEDNKFIQFQLKDEIRTYQVFAVYYYDWMKEAGYHYQTTDFQTEEGFLRHVRRAKERAMYDTNVEIEASDSILTLQTCVRNRDDLRLIVVAVEIDRK